MYIKKELEDLRGQLHKAFTHAGSMRFAATNDPGTGFSEELHKLAGELEALTLQARNLDEAYYTDGGIVFLKGRFCKLIPGFAVCEKPAVFRWVGRLRKTRGTPIPKNAIVMRSCATGVGMVL